MRNTVLPDQTVSHREWTSLKLANKKTEADRSDYVTHNGHFYHSTGSDAGEQSKTIRRSIKIYRLHIKFNAGK
ncbi:hypothetical protein S101395_02997 [Bacillus sonorensis]|uniref:Uncharacterized protein n=1 Tax=Bacillus sonorensis TaxID=119858 RepID=A0ABM6LJH8_9BACI|nr:hypothetical protein S101395_02997 [Bacillus sonorensis]